MQKICSNLKSPEKAGLAGLKWHISADYTGIQAGYPTRPADYSLKVCGW